MVWVGKVKCRELASGSAEMRPRLGFPPLLPHSAFRTNCVALGKSLGFSGFFPLPLSREYIELDKSSKARRSWILGF